MDMSKEELKVMVMLYAAGIDGNINTDEVETMLEKSSPATYAAVKRRIAKMSDMEMLDGIRAASKLYVTTEADRGQLLADIRAVIEADERCAAIEEHLYRNIEKLLR